jgi:hypothetical protein
MRRLPLFAAIAFAAAVPSPAWSPPAETAALKSINSALQAWVQAVDAGEPYLLLDLETAEVRLMQQNALLRSCPAVVDSFTGGNGEREVLGKIRRYWRAPEGRGSTGNPRSAFDWEDFLAEDGDRDCALWFSGRLLIYAAREWGTVRAPSVRLNEGDIRALYNAARPGMPLIVLPAGWNSAGR